MCADLKKIYGAVNLDDAEYAKEEFREKWDKKYPNILKSWDKNWADLTTFFEYPQEIRKIIYTTKGVGKDYQHFDLFTYEDSEYYNKSSPDENNIFSLNMKDHQGEDINENLKWIIASACCQVNSDTSFSACINNSTDLQTVSIRACSH